MAAVANWEDRVDMEDKQLGINLKIFLPHNGTILYYKYNNSSSYEYDNVDEGDYVSSFEPSDFKPSNKLVDDRPFPPAFMLIKLALAQ
jgi:hypothetical protein